MDRITTIARSQWRAYWRRFHRAGRLNAGNQGIILIFSLLLLARYLQALHTASLDLPQGKTRVFESLLSAVFLVWLFPLASNARTTIAIRKLLHLPLTLKELFAIRVVTLFIPPYTWVIVAGSLGICYPILRAQNAPAGVIAAILFIIFSALTGLTIAQLLQVRFWRMSFLVTAFLAGASIFYLVQHDGSGASRSLSSSTSLSPVTRAALGTQPWIAVGVLAFLTTLVFFTALWSFRKSLQVTPGQRSQRITAFNWLRIPGAVGGLAARDFRYFRRLLDPYLGVLAAALGSLYLVSAEAPSAGLFQVLLLIVVAPNAPLAFNSFGLDNCAVMERLKLLPVTGRTILLSKNLAFLMIIAVQLTPLILLASWRLGLSIVAIGIVEALAMAAMYMVWGNWMSVNHPLKMQFFQFSSSGGLMVEAIAGLMFGSLPGMIAIYLMHTEGLSAAWKVSLILLLSGISYLISLMYVGDRFAQKQDRIVSALS
jgi:hypothetical protein